MKQDEDDYDPLLSSSDESKIDEEESELGEFRDEKPHGSLLSRYGGFFRQRKRWYGSAGLACVLLLLLLFLKAS